MTEQEPKDLQTGFGHIASAYAQHTLPEDAGMWDVYGPPDCGNLTAVDILDHYANSGEIMAEPLAQALGLPMGSTYAEGVARIWEDSSHRYRAPRHEPSAEEKARQMAKREVWEAANPEDAAFVRELSQITDKSTRQRHVDTQPDDSRP
jgi:hypothetical protein